MEPVEPPTAPPDLNLLNLTHEQQIALDAVVAGKSVVVAGSAGSGKSHWIHAVKTRCPWAVITATTGLAAVNVCGVTIHKFANVGIADPGPHATATDERGAFVATAVQHLKKRIRSDVKQTIRTSLLLVIEECSMLSEYMYELLDSLFRWIRREPRKPWGGLQLVFVGDMRQLAPVAKSRDHPMMGRFFFESPTFDATFKGGVHVFTKIFRQEEAVLRDLLNRVAVGRITAADAQALQARVLGPSLQAPPTATRLFGTKDTVDTYNSIYLGQLTAPLHTYDMKVTKGEGATDSLSEWAIKNCIVEKHVTVAEGALVMLLWNIAPGFANGTVGYVVGYTPDGFPLFQPSASYEQPDLKSCHNVITVRPARWEVVDHTLGTVYMDQVPLKLAYALTIHKAQGIQLSEAVLTLDRSNCFADGQAYVALSRITTLEGMYLTRFDPRAIRASPAAVAFYEKYGPIAAARTAAAAAADPDWATRDAVAAGAAADAAEAEANLPPPPPYTPRGHAVPEPLAT